MAARYSRRSVAEWPYLAGGVILAACYIAFEKTELGENLTRAMGGSRALMWGLLLAVVVVFGAIATAVAWFLRDGTAAKALALGRRGDIDGGLRLLGEADASRKPSGQRADARGELLSMRGEFVAALEAFREAIRIDGPKANLADQYRIHEADALERLGCANEAIPIVDAILRRHRENFAARCVLARSLIRLGKLGEAEDEIVALRGARNDMDIGFGLSERFKADLADCETRLAEASRL